jgi:2-iminobutanoate/2-iminopropanoate deaminase
MRYDEKQVILSAKAPEAIGPYSAGMRIGNLVFTAGQLGIDRSTGELVSGGIGPETRQALKNLGYILESAASSLDLVVKTTVFLRDIADYPQMNAVYAEYFTDRPPTRSAVQVAALPKGAAVEIEAIAITAQPRGD